MDVYDKAVRYLKRKPEFIYDAWRCGFEPKPSLISVKIPGISNKMLFVCSRLFQGISKSGVNDIVKRDGVSMECGDLIQIAQDWDDENEWDDNSKCVAQTKKLTDAIKRDDRIPKSAHDLGPEHLELFAQWQRRVDKELKRTPYQV